MNPTSARFPGCASRICTTGKHNNVQDSNWLVDQVESNSISRPIFRERDFKTQNCTSIFGFSSTSLLVIYFHDSIGDGNEVKDNKSINYIDENLFTITISQT